MRSVIGPKRSFGEVRPQTGQRFAKVVVSCCTGRARRLGSAAERRSFGAPRASRQPTQNQQGLTTTFAKRCPVWERPFWKLCFPPGPDRNGVSGKRAPKRSLGARRII